MGARGSPEQPVKTSTSSHKSWARAPDRLRDSQELETPEFNQGPLSAGPTRGTLAEHPFTWA